MIFRILGSAAAEGWPGMFCGCECCAEARRRGGKDIRRRTSYQLGDKIHIDFGPDSYHSEIAFGLDSSKWEHLLISHSHQDHWEPQELAWRRRGFSILPPGSHLIVHGNEQVAVTLYAMYSDPSILAVEYQEAKPGETIALSDGVTATPVIASHAAEFELALNYVLHVDGRSILVGNDTGWYVDSTWDALAEMGLDVVVLDCTAGDVDYRDHHLGVEGVAAAKQEMLRRGIIREDTRFIANHFSHNGHMLHDALERFFAPHGIEVGYDGLEVEV